MITVRQKFLLWSKVNPGRLRQENRTRLRIRSKQQKNNAETLGTTKVSIVPLRSEIMEIKDRILNHSQALFTQNGIKSVSMDDIAASMAMSKKTIYKWFANKDEIVHGVMERHLAGTQSECGQIMAVSSSAIDETFRMMDWMKQQFAGVHPSIFYDLQKFYPATWELWLAHKNQYILKQIIDNLRRGMAEELYRADLDVDVLARLRLAQIELVFNPAVYPPAQFSVQRLQRIMLEHFILGVATLKGHKLINEYRHVTEEE